jgi:hypothetical protein
MFDTGQIHRISLKKKTLIRLQNRGMKPKLNSKIEGVKGLDFSQGMKNF